MRKSYRNTITACFIGYVVQAVVNNFAPLLFLTFESSFSIPLGQITTLITINFAVQLLVDVLSAGFVDRIGYRASVLLAHGFTTVGLVCLAFCPTRLPSPSRGY